MLKKTQPFSLLLRLKNTMLQKYIILLEKYLHNQLSYEERIKFEYTIANNIQLCEKLKSSANVSESTFLRMYYAIKEKLKYQIQNAG